MEPKPDRTMTQAEYLEMERTSGIKHEYCNGEAYAMTGASRRHNLIVANVIRSLGNQLRDSPCRIYPSDMRVKVERTGLLCYPDVSVSCGDEMFSDDCQDTLLTPAMIVEVLSDSTEGYDRGEKFWHYRQIPSLVNYVLISQHKQKIEVYLRNERGAWELEETTQDRGEIDLAAIGCRLSISEVYHKI